MTANRPYTLAELRAALMAILEATGDETMDAAARLALVRELAWSVLDGTFEAPALDVATIEEED